MAVRKLFRFWLILSWLLGCLSASAVPVRAAVLSPEGDVDGLPVDCLQAHDFEAENILPQSHRKAPEHVVAPILLYHHIAASDEASRYVLSPAVFEAQLHYLRRLGVTPVSLEYLVAALQEGAPLPLRPVILTFDDGYADVHQNALPIMQRLGFSGAVFVIQDQIGLKGYMDPDQIQDLLTDGWEVGSHSLTHTNLRRPGARQKAEIEDSRHQLEDLTSASIQFFSFPYGSTNAYVTRLVTEAGYQGAVGLGGSYNHSLRSLYYLSRIEIQGTWDLEHFAGLLPWTEPLPTWDCYR